VASGASISSDAGINLATGPTGSFTQSASSAINSAGVLTVNAHSANMTLTTAAHALKLTNTGNVILKVTAPDFNLQDTTVSGNFTVTATNGLVVPAGKTIQAGGNLSLSNTGAAAKLTIASGSTLTAGSLTGSGSAKLLLVPMVGLTGSTDVAKAGSITLKSSGISAGDGISIGTSVHITSNGSGITISSTKTDANINCADQVTLAANGGSITVNNTAGGAYLGIDSGTATTLTARTLNGSSGGKISVTGSKGVRIGGTATVNALNSMTLSSLNGAVSIAPGTGSTINVTKTVTIGSKTGVSLSDNTSITAGKPLKLSATGTASAITLGNTVSLISGVAGTTGGGLTISVAGNGGFTAGNSNTFYSEGGAFSLKSTYAGIPLTIGTGSDLKADGASFSVSSRGALTLSGGSVATYKVGTAGGGITIAGVNGVTLGDFLQINSATTLALTNAGTSVSTLQIGLAVTCNATTGLKMTNSNTAADTQIGNYFTMIDSAGPTAISASGARGGNAITIGTAATFASNSSAGIKINSTHASGSVTIRDGYSFTANKGGPIIIASGATTTAPGANALQIGVATAGGTGSLTAATTVALSAPGNLTLGHGDLKADGTTFAVTSKTGKTTVDTTSIQAKTAASITGSTVAIDNGAVITSGTTVSIKGTTTLADNKTVLLDNGARINATTTATIAGSTGVTIDNSTAASPATGVSGLTGVTIKTTATTGAPALTVGTGVNLTAGALSGGDPGSGVVNSTNLSSSGSLVLSAAVVNINGTNTPSTKDSLISTGKDLKITASSGNIVIGSGNTIQANGGNVQILAKGTIDAGDLNLFYARALVVSPTSSSGGGLELGSGLTTSTGISTAFGKAADTYPIDPNALGAGVSYPPIGSGGVIMVNVSGGAANPNLISSGTASTLPMNHGVEVFDTAGAAAHINVNNSTFKTDALKPIAMTTLSAPDEDSLVERAASINRTATGTKVATAAHPCRLDYRQAMQGKKLAQIYVSPRTELSSTVDGTLQLQSGEIFLDASCPLPVQAGSIQVLAGKAALASIRSKDGITYVRVCSSAGSVSVKVNGRTLLLNAGEELMACVHRPDNSEIHPADGMARRNSHTTAYGNTYVTISDFSIISMVSAHDMLCSLHDSENSADRLLLNRLLKTAATIDVVLRHRGAYSAR
jgi:hypothetical protein